MGNRRYGQCITCCLCCSFLLRGRTPHTLHLLQRKGPSHGRQPCTNCSNMSPSHRLQLFTNHPSCGSLPRGAVLQEQAAPASVPHEVTSPASKPALAWAPLSTGPQVLAGFCSSTVSPRGHSLPQASTCSGVGSLPGAAGGDLLHHGPLWTAGGQPGSPWSSSRAAREGSLLRHLKYLLPLLLH